MCECGAGGAGVLSAVAVLHVLMVRQGELETSSDADDPRVRNGTTATTVVPHRG